MVSLLLVELGSQTGEVLGIFGHFVGFSGGALSDSFVMVESVSRAVSWDGEKESGADRRAEPFSVKLRVPLNVFVLRHSWNLGNVDSDIRY